MVSALIDRLGPWLAEVGRHVEPDFLPDFLPDQSVSYTLDHIERDARTVWARWWSRDAVETSTDVQTACQGLALLALLARVDVDEWRRAIRIT
jgi:hypothetical protein